VLDEARPASGLRRNLLVPILARDDIESSVAIDVRHRHGFTAAEIERVFPESDGVVAGNLRAEIDHRAKLRFSAGVM
jgi:hypothetical protein